jgi:cysteine desulfurase family protein (TIGR01976 family)
MDTPAVRIEDVRAHFPALDRKHAGYPVAYFDGPGGTQVPRAVSQVVTEYLLHHNANTHWAYATSRETDEDLNAARSALADYLGCNPHEVCFGTNMTTLTYHLSRAIGRGLRPGDEILVTELDHHANIAPWRALEKERGVTVKAVPMIPARGTLDEEAFADLLSDRTRLVAIGAASNAIGTISNVRRLADQAHSFGALVFVDAVHYAAHSLMDVGAWDCDFLACSAYKFYGPHVGILFGRAEMLAGLDVPKLDPAPDSVPERLETGTLNHEGIVGAAAAVDFLASLGTGESRRERLVSASNWIHDRGSVLLEGLWDGLHEIDGVAVYGPPPNEPRTPTLSFSVDGYSSDEVSRRLCDDFGVFASHGDFYASTVVARLGYGEEGLVRAGCACYTTEEECDRLVDGIRTLRSTR